MGPLRIAPPIRTAALTYVLALGAFLLFRVALFLLGVYRLGPDSTALDVAQAFLMGLRFDTVIFGYIAVLPFFLLAIIHAMGLRAGGLTRVLFVLTFALFALAFLVSAADIPYFHHFFTRFSVDAFLWADSPVFILGMIAGEPLYWIVLLPYMLLLWAFHRLLKSAWQPVLEPRPREGSILASAVAALLVLGLMVVGIRGRLDEKSPIRVGTAYFGTDAFLNQLGLNPNFTLIRSWLDSRKSSNRPAQLMPDEEALALAQEFLGIVTLETEHSLARTVAGDRSRKMNVVLVLMESMSANHLRRHGNSADLTPFLDSIADQGTYFANCYSAGIHTFNGIYSSLFSYPAIFRQHSMKESGMLHFNGFGTTLKGQGYRTLYFTTHDGQFDNVEGFLRANDFDRVITKADYPAREVKTTLGVPDDYLFRYAVPVLDREADTGKPFFAALLTGSNHIPHYLPDYYSPRHEETADRMVAYSDWSLRRFFEEASRRPWFRNTLFIITGDHGMALDPTYEMPLSYNHVPLVFYAPDGSCPDTILHNPAGQIDIFPTAMGLLGLPYVNSSFGVDLLRQQRPFIYFNGDDKFGVIDSEWFLIARMDGAKRLHRYTMKDRTDHSAAQPEITERMYRYGAAQIQACQAILHRKQTDHAGAVKK